MAAEFRLLQLVGRKLAHPTKYASDNFNSHARIVQREQAGVVACLDAARTSEAIRNKELPATDDVGEGGSSLHVAYIYVSSNNISRAAVRYMLVPSADDKDACKKALQLANKQVCVNRELAWLESTPLADSVAETKFVATYGGAAAYPPLGRAEAASALLNVGEYRSTQDAGSTSTATRPARTTSAAASAWTWMPSQIAFAEGIVTTGVPARLLTSTSTHGFTSSGGHESLSSSSSKLSSSGASDVRNNQGFRICHGVLDDSASDVTARSENTVESIMKYSGLVSAQLALMRQTVQGRGGGADPVLQMQRDAAQMAAFEIHGKDNPNPLRQRHDGPETATPRANDGAADEPAGGARAVRPVRALATHMDGVEVRESTIAGAGQGCFATRPFARGDDVTAYDGTRLGVNRSKRAGRLHNVDVDKWLVADEAETQTHVASLRYEGVITIAIDGIKEPEVGKGAASLINHRPKTDGGANVKLVAVSQDQIVARATRPIASGDELFCNFGRPGDLQYDIMMGTHRLRAVETSFGLTVEKVRVEPGPAGFIDADSRATKKRVRSLTEDMDNVPIACADPSTVAEESLAIGERIAYVLRASVEREPGSAYSFLDVPPSPELLDEVSKIGAVLADGHDDPGIRYITLRLLPGRALVGFMSYRGRTQWHGAESAAFVQDLFIEPSYRGLGLATSLLTRLESAARLQRVGLLAAACKTSNGVGCNFWMKKSGWLVAEHGFLGEPGDPNASMDIFKPLSEDVKIPYIAQHIIRASRAVIDARMAAGETRTEATGRGLGFFLAESVGPQKMLAMAHIGMPLSDIHDTKEAFEDARPYGSDSVFVLRNGKHLDARSPFADVGRINTAVGLSGAFNNAHVCDAHGMLAVRASVWINAGEEVLIPYGQSYDWKALKGRNGGSNKRSKDKSRQ